MIGIGSLRGRKFQIMQNMHFLGHEEGIEGVDLVCGLRMIGVQVRVRVKIKD